MRHEPEQSVLVTSIVVLEGGGMHHSKNQTANRRFQGSFASAAFDAGLMPCREGASTTTTARGASALGRGGACPRAHDRVYCRRAADAERAPVSAAEGRGWVDRA